MPSDFAKDLSDLYGTPKSKLWLPGMDDDHENAFSDAWRYRHAVWTICDRRGDNDPRHEGFPWELQQDGYTHSHWATVDELMDFCRKNGYSLHTLEDLGGDP